MKTAQAITERDRAWLLQHGLIKSMPDPAEVKPRRPRGRKLAANYGAVRRAVREWIFLEDHGSPHEGRHVFAQAQHVDCESFDITLQEMRRKPKLIPAPAGR